MGDTDAVPMRIRRIIFEKYNNPDERFTNDEVFEALQKSDSLDKSVTIDDMEPHFAQLCNSGLMRNIAQNFTTQWFKLFDSLEAKKCPSCGTENHISKSEERTCLFCSKPL